MRGLARAVIVALLTLSACGVPVLMVGERCTAVEPGGTDDGACPPTCVMCGCCAHAAEAAALPLADSLEAAVAQPDTLVPRLPKTSPRDILHVPKPRFA
jgi:hypothetical protein